jgi:hypothetical protein
LANALAIGMSQLVPQQNQIFTQYHSLSKSRVTQIKTSAGSIRNVVEKLNHKVFGNGEITVVTLNKVAATITIKHRFWGSALRLVFDQLGVLTGITTATKTIDNKKTMSWDIPWQSSSGQGFFQQAYPVVDGLREGWHSATIVIKSKTINKYAALVISGFLASAKHPFPKS